MITQKNILGSKRASTLGAWIETMLFLVLVVGILGIIGTNMNSLHNQENDLTFGFVTNSTLDKLSSFEEESRSDINEGQASQTSLGLFVITTVPKILSTIWNLIWGFLTGAWIGDAVHLIGLGESEGLLITVLRILYFASIVFIIIKIVTRVNP